MEFQRLYTRYYLSSGDWLPIWFPTFSDEDNFPVIFSVLSDSETTGIAVGIPLLSGIRAKIYVFPTYFRYSDCHICTSWVISYLVLVNFRHHWLTKHSYTRTHTQTRTHAHTHTQHCLFSPTLGELEAIPSIKLIFLKLYEISFQISYQRPVVVLREES